MGVFLRWGIFGILSVAAMVYAYNASKRMAENRQTSQPVVVSQADGEADESGPEEESEEDSEEEAEPLEALPVACDQERLVAELALKMRRDGEPLDRLLRIETIAFQPDVQRRERLEAVARHWFEREGADPDGAALRAEVLRDCRLASPAP